MTRATRRGPRSGGFALDVTPTPAVACGGRVADHDAYIAGAPEDLRPLLVNVRGVPARTLPDAEEVVAYAVPGFRIGKPTIAGYAAFSKQCGLYLFPSTIASHADDIAAAGLTSTRTSVTFSPSRPIPDELVERLALASRRDQGL